MARLAGADNYGGEKEYLEEIIDEFVEGANWHVWETVDVVQINRKGHLSPRDIFLELYRYQDEGSDRAVCGHDHLHYEVRADRYMNGEYETTYLNNHAEETEKELEEESVD